MTYVRALPKAAGTARLPTTRLALQTFDRFNCRQILDAGCGDCYFEETFPDRFVGVDIEPHRLQSAAQRGVRRLLVGDALQLPFADEQFDGVLAKDLIEHLHVEQAFRLLHEVRRVLRPGGVFITVTFKNTQSFWDKPDHIRPYSNKWVRRVMTCEIGGFEVVLERGLSGGIPGFGLLGLEPLAHALAHYLNFRNHYGIIGVRKTG